jgi:hypothetical protein
MKKFSLIILICVLFVSFQSLLADNKAVKGIESSDEQEIVKYGIKINYPVKSFSNIKINEITNVHRIYPDSTTKDYSREINYYTTSEVPSSPEDGFQTVNVTVDSMHYKFTEGEVEFEYNSIDMKGKALRFKDLNCKTVPLGREFELVYSPYGEIAKIGGEEIDETLNYVIERGEGYLSETDKYVWLNGLSKEHLAYLGDLQKIMQPIERMAIDSIWYSPFNIEINGYNFYDTLALKIMDYNAGMFIISGESLSLHPFNKKSFAYNISDLCEIHSVKGTGNFKLELSARGVIKSVGTDYKIKVKLKVEDQIIEEIIDSKIIWDVQGVFRL